MSRQLLWRQLERDGADVLVEPGELGGAGDRRRSTASGRAARPARSGPASRCFRSPISRSRSTTAWFAFLASGAKRGTMLRKSVLSNVVGLVDLAGQEAFAERAEWHEADAELLERGQHLRFRLAPPQRVLALQRGHRLHRVGAANRLHAGLGQPEVPDLAFANQVLDRARDVLDRDLGIDAVLIEEVDGVDLQAPQRRLGDLADVRRPAVQAAPARRWRSRTSSRSRRGRGSGSERFAERAPRW